MALALSLTIFLYVYYRRRSKEVKRYQNEKSVQSPHVCCQRYTHAPLSEKPIVSRECRQLHLNLNKSSCALVSCPDSNNRKSVSSDAMHEQRLQCCSRRQRIGQPHSKGSCGNANLPLQGLVLRCKWQVLEWTQRLECREEQQLSNTLSLGALCSKEPRTLFC